nr:trichohyalin-like [Parasteatoda tepidariorum]
MAFLNKAKKVDLIELADELGESVPPQANVCEIKKIIQTSKHYEVEDVKMCLTRITEERIRREELEKQERREELERQERREELERQERREELERQERREELERQERREELERQERREELERQERREELERQERREELERQERREELERQERREELERQERREELERQERREELERQHQLELRKLELEANSQIQHQNRPVSGETNHKIQILQITPKFNEGKDEMSLYLINFERRAEIAQIPKDEWVPYLLSVVPPDISNMLARESPNDANNYDFVKELILKQYKLNAEELKQNFYRHFKSPEKSWRNFAQELNCYFSE